MTNIYENPLERITEFRVPSDLTKTEKVARKVLCVGSCVALLASEVFKVYHDIDVETIHIGAIDTFDFDKFNLDFDFQLLTLPMDNILPRHAFFFDDLNDLTLANERFAQSIEVCRRLLSSGLKLNIERGITTFVGNFFIPQQNPQGRLLPRYDLRNPVYFFEKLNEFLASEVSKYRNAYILDVDSIAATFGKAYIQDDSIWGLTHGGVITELDFELYEEISKSGHNRIEPIPRIRDAMRVTPEIFWRAICMEAITCYRILKQVDQVKVVVIDLDDTLWRGVIAEDLIDDVNQSFEGMPYGFIESLLYLKSRGIALAIVSKNSEEVVTEFWERAVRQIMRFDDFVITKINWDSKAENIRQIAKQLNVDLNSIVFIDDNPREREEVLRILPEVRVLGSDSYSIRRTLLWASETQVSTITLESRNKTEMFKSQIEREAIKQIMTRAEFLETLELKLDFKIVENENDPAFNRILELLNKTNQFNTCGIRWTFEEATKFFSSGGYAIAFSATDRLTNYGIISSAMVLNGEIQIFVMSCRVIGLDIEIACLRLIEAVAKSRDEKFLRSKFIRTDKNLLAESLFERANYTFNNGMWGIDLSSSGTLPKHIVVNSACPVTGSRPSAQ